jgi:hypothetical protein
MTCGPFMCSSHPLCGDRQCPGHPQQLAAHACIGVEEERPDYDYVPADEISGRAALAGFAAVLILVAGLAWVIYTVAPLFAAVH